ncbi:hypothetical protein [Shinella zoogloeoides]|uniref:hypothetical protein n=1 Tax=Shinella zoogloeoides TaxID=352475 RepID=UPI001F563523|nr:hypothetical protein [Shinella zoogloeoides]
MPHVLIENGIVVQLDLTGNPPDGYIECPDEVQPGYTYDGETWAAPPIPGPPEPVSIVYPVDLWSRMTDAEADAVVQAMTTQPVRIQNIFRAASSYRSDHELWPLLVSVATSLFGSERAAEILAAS